MEVIIAYAIGIMIVLVAVNEWKKSSNTLDSNTNKSESLFDRNREIIEKFVNKIVARPPYSRYQSYYIDNVTRDCINEICLAEKSEKKLPRI